MGGLVVLITTGKNPIETYRAIFEGAGLNWFFDIPWDFNSVAAFNLQQTLIQTTSLILVGLAVAFAFRCGLFNIGGQGQYLSGAILAVWVGSSFEGMSPVLHVIFAIVVGTATGALIGGIAGFLKATVGAHEVITTIMLNWTVVWVGVFLFGLGGPLVSIGAPKFVSMSFGAHRRTRAVSAYVTAPPLGATVAAAGAHSVFIPLFGSWRGAFSLYGVFALGSTVVWATVRTRGRRPQAAMETSVHTRGATRALLRVPAM